MIATRAASPMLLIAALLLLLAPAAAAGAPKKPAKLRAEASGDTSVLVKWRNRSRGARPQVAWRKVAAPKKRTKLVRRRRGATRFQHRGLEPDSLYSYRVRACKRGRCSKWTKSRRARTLPRGSNGGSTPPGGPTTIASCPIFPANNPWNRDISGDPVDPRSDAYIASIGATGTLDPNFGSNPALGIPFVVVPASQKKLPVSFIKPGQSDPGPYPIPANAPREATGNHRVVALQEGTCRLYELCEASFSGGRWNAFSGATFNLRSNALRPDGWTSADTAGLPILPGLVRYNEVKAGAIRHALRFTVQQTQAAFVHPATHLASSNTDPNLPPMGLRLRLKASFPISSYSRETQVILTALKRYGMFVADSGPSWSLTGAPDSRWNDAALAGLRTVPGSAFEVVKSGPLLGKP